MKGFSVTRGLFAALLCTSAPSLTQNSSPPAAGDYLYVWAGDADEKDSDFLAVIDTRPGSKSFGQVVATRPVGAKGTMPHHIEYETPSGNTIFANGWKGAHSFIFDVTDPRAPGLVGDFKMVGDYSHPHSFARLPNGNVAVTFQSVGEKYAPEGALVELDNQGKFVRAARSATPDIPREINWPYSLVVLPEIDRIVTTSTDMGNGPDWKSPQTRHIQFWSIKDMTLLSSLALPESGKGEHRGWPAEPRPLSDGSLYVNTFNCGLYKIEGAGTARPSAKFVHAFPGGTGPHDMCAVPVVHGKYWVQTVGAINGVIVLDTSNPDAPREVSRLILGHEHHMPHWISADRSSNRLALTGSDGSWVLMLTIDDKTGKIIIDDSFRASGSKTAGVSFDRLEWPHGKTGKAVVHGVLFSR